MRRPWLALSHFRHLMPASYGCSVVRLYSCTAACVHAGWHTTAHCTCSSLIRPRLNSLKGLPAACTATTARGPRQLRPLSQSPLSTDSLPRCLPPPPPLPQARQARLRPPRPSPSPASSPGAPTACRVWSTRVSKRSVVPVKARQTCLSTLDGRTRPSPQGAGCVPLCRSCPCLASTRSWTRVALSRRSSRAR
jgi:hypothetical protein